MNPRGKWPGLLAGLLVAAAFFEGSGFSFHVMGFRVRSVQVLEILFIGFLGLLWLLGRWHWRRSPLDYWLLAYLSINLVAIFNSAWKARSLKIFLLLVSLVLLYWLVYQLLRDANDILLAFHVFLAMGALQVLFGIYQVVAGALNHYRGWSLPIGHMGVVHREYIHSVWGRPYGTQVEPDFYGAICMVFALIFIILYFFENGTAKKWFQAGACLSMLGLYFSFVRASWLVFFLVLLALPFFGKRFPAFRLTWKSAVLIIGIAVGIHFFAVNWAPTFRNIHHTRFSTKNPLPPPPTSWGRRNLGLGPQLNAQNVRLFTMRISLKTWSEHPVIGNGPGSFGYIFWRSVFDEEKARRFIAEGYLPWTNPSIFFSVLGDTGLIGLFIFLAMAVKFIFLCRAKLAGLSAPPAAQAFALAVGLTALFLSYLVTTGLWLPLTWVFLALAVASQRRFPASGGERNEAEQGA